MSAIIFGSGPSAIGAMRDARAAGFAVHHVSPKPNDIASSSRYADSHSQADLDKVEPTLHQLLEKARGRESFIWACNDGPVEFVSRQHSALSERAFIPLPAWDQLEPTVDKLALYELSNRCGIPAPRAFPPSMQTRFADTGIEFPCLVKPTQTPDYFARYQRKLHVVDDLSALTDLLKDTAQHGLKVMICELVPGGDSRLESIAIYRTQGGETAGEMAIGKLRKHPQGFGSSCASYTKPLDRHLLDYSRHLLAVLNYRGFAAIEWKWDVRTDMPKLMEINPRPVGYQTLFLKAGINYAEFIKDDASGRKLSGQRYRSNCYWIDPFADPYEFQARRKNKDFSYRRFFRPYFSNPAFALTLTDPGPWIAGVRRVIRAGG